MNRTLVLVRHAQADWNNNTFGDYGRPLTETGLKDASLMGKELKEEGICPDYFFSSTAQRAVSTSKLLARELNFDLSKISWSDKLYMSDSDEIENSIKEGKIPDEVKTLVIVAHNPGISFLALLSCQGDLTLNSGLPPGGLVAVKLDAENWSDFDTKKCKFLFFKFPPKL